MFAWGQSNHKPSFLFGVLIGAASATAATTLLLSRLHNHNKPPQQNPSQNQPKPQTTPQPHPQPVRVRHDILVAFAKECLVKSGSCAENANQVAEVLVAADARGIHSHGLNRLELYCDELQRKAVSGTGSPTILSQHHALTLVDGNNLQGAVVGNFCMKLAIQMAQQHGVGWVVVRNTCHFGIAGWYSEMAAHAGMVGLCFTNTSPVVVPTNSKRPGLGTNPIACAGACCDQEMEGAVGGVVSVDLATPTVALGKVEIALRENKPIPLNWGLDSEGNPTTDPNAVIFGGGLCPLGGNDSSHKGYALGVMVEMLTGVFCGSNFGTDVGQSMNPNAKGRTERINLGQCFVAVNPDAVCPGYKERLSKFCGQMHSLPQKANAPQRVLVPGEPEALNTRNAMQSGVPLPANVFAAISRLGQTVGVSPPVCC